MPTEARAQVARATSRRHGARWPGCWSPTSPASWPARTPRCCWPTSAPRWSRSRARGATTPAPGSRRCATGRLDLLPRRQPQQALDRARPQGPRRPGRSPGELARRADVVIENFKPGGLAPLRPRLRHRRARPTPASSTPRSAASAAAGRARALPGYDLIVQAISGLMSLTGDPGRRAVPRRHLGLRRDGRPARDHRRARRAARTRHDDRPRPARRGQPAVLGAVRAWSTSPAPTSPAASSRSGWATATRACSPTSRCPAPTAT